MTEKVRFVLVGILFIVFLLIGCAGCSITPDTQGEATTILVTPVSGSQEQTPTHSLSFTLTSTIEPTSEALPIGYILFAAEELGYDPPIYKWGRANDIWLFQKGDPTPRRWIKDRQFKSQPFVSPDGSQVAYVVSKIVNDLAEESVWIADTDGTNSRQISPSYSIKSPEVLHVLSPARAEFLRIVYINLCGWSADGQRLAYIVHGESPGDPYLLFVVDVLSSQVMRIEGDDIHSAVWSPYDPDVLVMNQYDTSYLVYIKTNQQIRIGQLEGKNIPAAWTPDGQHLFAVIRDDPTSQSGKTGIVIIAKNLETSYRISVQDIVWEAWWSPDATRIAYLSNLSGDKGALDNSLLVINNDGSNRKVLIEQSVLDVYFMPFAWSLDSKWIVGFGRSGSNYGLADLYSVNVETGDSRIWATDLPAPTVGRMVWCYETHCVNGGYLDF